MKPLLVGELNPYGADPRFALYPLPEHASGGRLARILGMSRGTYLRAFDRVNLCTGRWSAPAARAEARVLQSSPHREVFVLLGRKVCDAFGVNFKPFEALGTEGRRYVVLPHPSGRNRAWNAPDAAPRARALVLSALVDVLAGSETCAPEL